MPVLSSDDRAEVSIRYQRRACERRAALPLTKAELRAAVDAVDDWWEANQSAYNQAIPQPARSALGAKAKAELLFQVIIRRLEV